MEEGFGNKRVGTDVRVLLVRYLTYSTLVRQLYGHKPPIPDPRHSLLEGRKRGAGASKEARVIFRGPASVRGAPRLRRRCSALDSARRDATLLGPPPVSGGARRSPCASVPRGRNGAPTPRCLRIEPGARGGWRGPVLCGSWWWRGARCFRGPQGSALPSPREVSVLPGGVGVRVRVEGVARRGSGYSWESGPALGPCRAWL